MPGFKLFTLRFAQWNSCKVYQNNNVVGGYGSYQHHTRVLPSLHPTVILEKEARHSQQQTFSTEADCGTGRHAWWAHLMHHETLPHWAHHCHTVGAGLWAETPRCLWLRKSSQHIYRSLHCWVTILTTSRGQNHATLWNGTLSQRASKGTSFEVKDENPKLV